MSDALSMTNCISATVRDERGAKLFNGQPRGIGGDAIRDASIAQVRRFANLIEQRGYSTRLVGVGGISTADHVRQYLDAGAEAVHLATAIMLDSLVGVQIRRDLTASATGDAA